MKSWKLILALTLIFTNLSAFAQENAQIMFEEIHFKPTKTEINEPQKIQKTTLKGNVYRFEDQTPKYDHYFDIGRENYVYGHFKFDVNDPENQHIDKIEANLSGKLLPKIKYHSDFKAYDLFNSKQQGEFSNSFYLSTDAVPNHNIYLGQAKLSKDEDRSISFIESMENLYGQDDIGIKVGGSWDAVDYSIGAYDFNDFSKNDSTSAMGATAAFKPLYFDPSLGKLELGGAYYSKNIDDSVKNTYGIFSRYKYKRVMVKGEFSKQNDFSISEEELNNWNISNKIKLTSNLSFITKYDQQVETQRSQNDFSIEYSPDENSLLKINNIKLKFNASYIRDEALEERKRFGITTKYSF